MSNISVTTVQNTIAVTETSGITVTTPEGQTINVEVPNSTVNVTNTTDDITVVSNGTVIFESGVKSVNGDTGPAVVLDTDDIGEGATNKYFSQALARQSLSAGTGISYDNVTGVITNTSINTDTTYTIASASTSGGANLNLVGSDSSTDSVAYKGAGATTVTSTDANTITITSTDTNTTYTQNASSTTGGANLNLVGSDSTTDSIKLASGTNVTVTRTDADTITFSSTDTNTTYTQNFSSTTGGTNLNLVGSDSTTDTVKFANGTGVSVAYTDADTATISIGQSVGTGDSPSFAGGTFGNITVGVATDNTIASTDTNGNIILDPNGTGNVVMTFANGANLTNDRNYVSGIIRQTAAASAGDIWGFGTGTTSPVRGIYLDNSATSTTTTGKRNGVVMRNTSNTPRNSIIGEVARGTNPSSPTVPTGGTNLVEMAGGGYYGGGSDSGWTTGNGFGNTGSIRLNAGETWTSTNTGTALAVLASGIGAYAGVAPQTLLSMSSNSSAFVSDNPTFVSKQTAIGGTFKYMLDILENEVDVGGRTLTINSRQEAGDSVIQAYDSTSLGTLTWDGTNWIVSSDLQITGNDILNSAGQTNISMTSDRSQTTITSSSTTFQDPASSGNNVLVETTPTKSVYALYGVSADGSVVPTVNYNGYRKVSGNNVATLTNDKLGQFTFNGNINTGTGGPSSNVVGAEIRVYASEDWDNTKAGTGVGIEITKQGTNTNTNVFLSNVLSTEITGDTIVLQDSSGNDLVNINSAGNITLDPSGSGDIVLTLANGGNLTNSRNYVYGAIRNSTTENNGDHWSILSGASAPYRGISLDNSIDTTKRPGMAIRSYGVSGGAPRTGIIFEGARGTAASPTNLNNGDVIGDIFANGYVVGGGTSAVTGWASDQVGIVPGIARFYTTEAWNDGLNKVGTGFRILLQPSSTALTTSSPVTAFEATANSALVQKLFNVVNNRSTGGSDFATINFSTQKFTSPNFIPTSLGDTLGQFKFNGNTSSGPSSTPGAPAAIIGAQATENWTSTANGTAFYFNVTKTGTTTQVPVITGGSDSTTFNSDAYTFADSSGTAVTSAAINYTRTYGEFAYVNAAGFNIPAQNTIYTMPLDTTLNAQGTSISGTGNININVSGWYKIIMSLQATSSHNGVASFVFWLRKNGTDVANSKTEVDFLKDQKSVIAMDWLVNSDGNDYWEIVYATASAAYADIAFPTIAATSTPFVSPVAPAVIFNVIPIGA